MNNFNEASGEENASSMAVVWRVWEETFRSDRTYPTPDTDVDIRVRFTAPDGSTIVLPAFWNGDNEWCVRFAPTQPGRWTYATEASNAADNGLNGIVGALCAEIDPHATGVHRHGFVRVSDDRRGFAYADGTPFFWLGDTHWQAFNYERLHESNDPAGGDSQFRDALDIIVAQGFSVYQTYPDPMLSDGGGNVSQVDWWSDDGALLNPTAFRDQFDVMVAELAERGLVIALGVGVHWNSGRAGAEALTRFARYMVARYAAYPVVWITGQEVDVENGLGTLPVWHAVAETIADADGYRHPLGAHMDSVGEPTTFGDEAWHQWFPTQGGHGRLRGRDHYRTYWDYEPTKPFLETEANYEGILDVTLESTRRSAWIAMQCGSRGYTYGSAGVWAMKWDVDVPGWDDYHELPWFRGIRLPGRDQMRHLKTFYLGLPNWHALVPQFDVGALRGFDDPQTSLLASDGTSTWVVYFFGSDGGTGTLTGLDPALRYRARWFDPRTGDFTDIGGVRPTPEGFWRISLKPDEGDWVLLLLSEGTK